MSARSFVLCFAIAALLSLSSAVFAADERPAPDTYYTGTVPTMAPGQYGRVPDNKVTYKEVRKQAKTEKVKKKTQEPLACKVPGRAEAVPQYSRSVDGR